MEVSGQLHALANLAPGKERRYPFDRRVDGPRAGLDATEKRKNLSPPTGNRIPAVQPVAQVNRKLFKTVSSENGKNTGKCKL
jgi:hypothetical protein